MVMAMQQQDPVPEEVWLVFDGKAKKFAGGYRLYPKSTKGVSIDHKSSDVRYSGVSGSILEIRLGAHAVDITVAPKSPFNDAPKSGNYNAACMGGETFCVAGIEYCCSNNKVVGNCVGIFRCSSKY